MTRLFRFSLILCLVGLLAACAGPAAPTATPKPEGVVVTFRVANGENYKIRLTDPADIEIARKLLAGHEAPAIPNGLVVRGDPDVNVGYSWHIDPASVDFADFTTEVCDGLPSDVEKAIITSDRYCPWSAKVIAIDELSLAGARAAAIIYAPVSPELTRRLCAAPALKESLE